jgi:hypothetical protein
MVHSSADVIELLEKGLLDTFLRRILGEIFEALASSQVESSVDAVHTPHIRTYLAVSVKWSLGHSVALATLSATASASFLAIFCSKDERFNRRARPSAVQPANFFGASAILSRSFATAAMATQNARLPLLRCIAVHSASFSVLANWSATASRQSSATTWAATSNASSAILRVTFADCLRETACSSRRALRRSPGSDSVSC